MRGKIIHSQLQTTWNMEIERSYQLTNFEGKRGFPIHWESIHSRNYPANICTGKEDKDSSQICFPNMLYVVGTQGN